MILSFISNQTSLAKVFKLLFYATSFKSSDSFLKSFFDKSKNSYGLPKHGIQPLPSRYRQCYK